MCMHAGDRPTGLTCRNAGMSVVVLLTDRWRPSRRLLLGRSLAFTAQPPRDDEPVAVAAAVGNRQPRAGPQEAGRKLRGRAR